MSIHSCQLSGNGQIYLKYHLQKYKQNETKVWIALYLIKWVNFKTFPPIKFKAQEVLSVNYIKHSKKK